jgi:hypothetical protein
MSAAPEYIWAWEFLPEKQNCLTKGGWDDKADRKLTQYIRADIAEARISELEARPVKVKPLAEYSALELAKELQKRHNPPHTGRKKSSIGDTR